MAYALVQATILLTVSGICMATGYIPPRITSPNSSHQNLYFQNGSSVNVTCKGTGSPAPTFKWLENDTEIQPSLNITYRPATGDLHIANFSLRYQNSYRCVATNQFQQVNVSTMSTKVHLWQMRLETYDSKTDEIKHVMEHRYLQLPCGDRMASIALKLYYNWYNAVTLSTLSLGAGRLYIDEDGTLHFTRMLLGDGDISYTCGISATDSVDRSIIKLGKKYIVNVTQSTTNVAIRPKLEYSNTVHHALKNSTGILQCMFSGYGSHIIPRQWWANAENVPYANGSKYNISLDGRQLFLHNLQEEDEKFYFCHASNPAGEATAVVYLNVTSGPVFPDGPPKDQIGLVNSKVIFTCDAKSIKDETPPRPPVWFTNSRKLAGNYDASKFLISNYGKTLTIANLRKPQDIMSVQCEVENGVDTVLATAFLDVVLPIRIMKQPKAFQKIIYKDKIDLTVLAISDESMKVNYRWTMPNRTIEEGSIPAFMSWNPTTKAAFIDTRKMPVDEYLQTEGKYTITVYTAIQSITLQTQVELLEEILSKTEEVPSVLLYILLAALITTILTVAVVLYWIIGSERTALPVQEEQARKNISNKPSDSGPAKTVSYNIEEESASVDGTDETGTDV